MEASGVVDPSTKPIVLFGTDTALLGAIVGPYPSRWRQKTAGRALHVVLEGSEPSTGQRWCRTYFLQHGQVATTSTSSITNSNRNSNSSRGSRGIIVDSKNNDDDAVIGNENDSSISRDVISYTLSEDVSLSIHRLESLYMKLLISLRWLVKSKFSKHSDVLEAGTEIQVMMMRMMMLLVTMRMRMMMMMMMTLILSMRMRMMMMIIIMIIIYLIRLN